MSLRKVLVYCFIFYTFSLQALELPLLVKDGDLDIPLEGVYVYVKNLPQAKTLTDTDGNAILSLPDNIVFPLTILCATPGYAVTAAEIKSSGFSSTKENPLVITMVLDTVLEGEELVVEGERKGKIEEKPGVAIVRTSEELKTTAQIGIIADVMTAVAALPGVGFKLGMNTDPSIRGGYPAEMGVTFDGMYLIEPFFWDGMVSILSPYMVDSVKLSTGIFSARYGQGTSGLLDTSSANIGDAKKLTFNISTISADAAIELPLGDKNKLFLYAHATDLSSIKWLARGFLNALYKDDKESLAGVKRIADLFKRMPYIYSVYGKWEFTPVPDLSLAVQALFAMDGSKLAIETKVTDSYEDTSVIDPFASSFRYYPYATIDSIQYTNMQAYNSLNVRWLPSRSSFVNILGSYAIHSEVTDNRFYEYIFGISSESDHDGNDIITGVRGYSETEYKTEENKILQQVQGKAQTDISLASNSILSFGLEEVYKTYMKSSHWLQMDVKYTKDEYGNLEQVLELLHVNQSFTPLNNTTDSSLFALWAFGSNSSLFEGELGLRAEHYYLWNKEANFDMNSIPSVNPRARVVYTPLQNKGMLSRLSLSAGSGLYSALSEAAKSIQKDSFLSSSLVPDTAWTSVLGTRLELDEDFKLTLEGYYKYYLSRMYVFADERDLNSTVWYTRSDGQGYTAGADLMVEKKISSWFSGYVSYSFLYARFYNPSLPQYDTQTTTTGDPLGLWYYPSYHRFHTFHAVLDFFLPKDMTLTLGASYATGALCKSVIDKEEEMMSGTYSDPNLDTSGKIRIYSDTDRHYADWPIDVRFSRKGTFKNPKKTWEWYIAVENLLGFISEKKKTEQSAKAGLEYESSGWVIGEGMFKVDMGWVPLPSFGVKFQL